jgi:hypothetical protein
VRRPSASTLAIVGITLVGLGLRLAHYGESLAEDEFLTYGEIHGRSFLDVLETVRGGVEQHPPLSFVLAWAAEKLGDSSQLIRLPSLIGGTAAIPLLYLLGARTVGRAAGLAAAAFMALSPFAIFQSVEARPYGLLIFFATASTLCLLVALDERRLGWWALYWLAACGVLYTHNFGIFVLAAQAVWAFWVARDRRREVVLVHALVALAYAPWVPAFINRGTEAPAFLKFFKPLDWTGARRELLSFFPGHPSFIWSELPGRAAVTALLLTLATAVIVFAVRTWQRGVPRPSARLVLVLALALATPLGFLAYSLSGPHTMTARYLTASLPAILLAIGALLTSLPRQLAGASVALVVAVLAIGAGQSFADDHRRPDYEAAARYVEARSDRDDGVIFADVTLGASGDVVLRGGRALSIEVYLKDRDIYPIFESGDVVPAYTRAGRKRRIFVIGPGQQPQPPDGLGARRAGRRELPGSLALAVTTWEPAGKRFTPERIRTAAGDDELGAGPILSCLEDEGFAPARAEGSPEGSATLEVPLSGGGRISLYVYGSEAVATRRLPEIRTFIEGGTSGSAERRGRTVVGYLEPPPPDALRRVEGCLP